MADITIEFNVEPKPEIVVKQDPEHKLVAEVAPIVPPEEKPKPKMIDPATVITVLGLLSKLPLSDTAKGYLFKAIIFAVGVFCGIGLVYKSGVTPPVTPPANVSVYQKKIDDLQKENADLHKTLDDHAIPAPVGPKPPVTIPDEIPVDKPRPGFVLPGN